VRGRFFYLYLIVDIFSRKIVGWEVHEQECGEAAAALVQRVVLAEQCLRKPLVLHADNGSPMKSQTLQAKLYDLGITPSHSWPRVSNDNPYSESVIPDLEILSALALARVCFPVGRTRMDKPLRALVQRNETHRHSPRFDLLRRHSAIEAKTGRLFTDASRSMPRPKNVIRPASQERNEAEIKQAA
jgi:transposase InsO family protein